jgi:hypothetical protein
MTLVKCAFHQNCFKKMSYYKTIDGKKMDGTLLDIAEEAVAGAGDGRISKQDAETIIAAVKDSGEYTDVEKDTMEYIRDNFKWTEGADEWFSSQIASWAATK